MRTSTAFLVLILFFLWGCASTIADPSVRRAAGRVEILTPSQAKTHKFSIIKEVAGLSCPLNTHDSPDKSVAMDEMLVEAGKLGADGVVDVACTSRGMSMNCAHSIECRGDAVKYTD